MRYSKTKQINLTGFSLHISLLSNDTIFIFRASKHVGCPEQIEAIGGQSSSSRDGLQNHIVVSSKTSFGRISLLNGELG
jgi:hypothetical protein